MFCNINLDGREVILDPIELDPATLAGRAHSAVHVDGVLQPDVGRGFVYRLGEESDQENRIPVDGSIIYYKL